MIYVERVRKRHSYVRKFFLPFFFLLSMLLHCTYMAESTVDPFIISLSYLCVCILFSGLNGSWHTFVFCV